jgi:putative transposase
LEIAPTTNWSTKTRPRCARAKRDADLGPKLEALWVKNYSVYGRRKLTRAAHKAGIDIGRDQVARLMQRTVCGARAERRDASPPTPTSRRSTP